MFCRARGSRPVHRRLLPITMRQALGEYNDATMDAIDGFAYPGQERSFVKGDLGCEDNMRSFGGRTFGQSRARGHPSRVAAHHFNQTTDAPVAGHTAHICAHFKNSSAI